MSQTRHRASRSRKTHSPSRFFLFFVALITLPTLFSCAGTPSTSKHSSTSRSANNKHDKPSGSPQSKKLVIGTGPGQQAILYDLQEQTKQEIDTWAFPHGVTSYRNKIYLANKKGSKIHRHNLDTGENKKIDIGGKAIHLHTFGKRIIAPVQSGYLVVINAEEDRIIKKIKTGKKPHMAIRKPGTNLIYVTVRAENKLLEIDLNTFEIVREMKNLRELPFHLAWVNDEIWVSFPAHQSLSVIDPESLQIKEWIETGPNPAGLEYDPESQRVILIDRDTHDLHVYDSETYKQEKILQTGGGEGCSTGTLDGYLVFSFHDGHVELYDPSTLERIQTFETGKKATGISILNPPG